MTQTRCSNCRGPDGHHVSYDLDLPTVVLCSICALTLATQPDMFDDLRGARADLDACPITGRKDTEQQ